MNFTFENRENPSLKKAMAAAIYLFSHYIPNGMLIFFPSYDLLEGFVNWVTHTFVPGTTHSYFNKISSKKTIHCECKDITLSAIQLKLYRSEAVKPIDGKTGSIFLAVMNGRVAEGIDFRDKEARGVLIFGIPFANITSEKVMLKYGYLDAQSKTTSNPSLKNYTGSKWYNSTAIRSINQAMGRVIRHKNDYGIILLFDDRLPNSEKFTYLSSWMKKESEIIENHKECTEYIIKLFSNRSQHKEFERSPELKTQKHVDSDLTLMLDHIYTGTKPKNLTEEQSQLSNEIGALLKESISNFDYLKREDQSMNRVQTKKIKRLKDNGRLTKEEILELEETLNSISNLNL